MNALAPLLPEGLLAAGLMGALLVELGERPRQRGTALWLGIAASAAAVATACTAAAGTVADMLAFDRIALLARPAIAAVTLLVLLAGLGQRQAGDRARDPGAWTTTVLGTGLGAMIVAAASNVIALWLGLELVALSSYALAAWSTGTRAGDRRAAEAGMKYVLFGGIATALMLFGISHLYGLTGHFDFAGIGRELVGMPLAATAALLLAATGAAYKLTVVPFHFYSPDVYQGAPPLGIAAATAAPKLAVGAALLRAVAAMLPPSTTAEPVTLPAGFAAGLAVAASASLLVAALLALAQRDAKRIVAFSGIGHGGTVLLALAGAPDPLAAATVLHYLLAYAAANVGALVCLAAIERRHGTCELAALPGAGAERPWLAAALCLSLFSLAGVPPLAGFLGKWAVLQQVLARGLHGEPWLLAAAFALLLSTAIAAWAYLLIVRAVVLMPVDPAAAAARGPAPRLPWPTAVAAAVAVLATLVLGCWLDVLPTLARALTP